MESRGVTVAARVRARDGKIDELRAELLALVAPTRRERGCINYDLHGAADDPALFMFYENWESRASLDAHLAAPHLERFDERTRELLAGPVEITLWERLEQ